MYLHYPLMWLYHNCSWTNFIYFISLIIYLLVFIHYYYTRSTSFSIIIIRTSRVIWTWTCISCITTIACVGSACNLDLLYLDCMNYKFLQLNPQGTCCNFCCCSSSTLDAEGGLGPERLNSPIAPPPEPPKV